MAVPILAQNSADQLSRWCGQATLASPLVLLAIVGAATLGTLSASSGQGRRVLGPSWLGGISAGLLGCFLLETRDGNQLESIILGPFLFCKWFVLGFAPRWLWCTLRHEPSRRAHVAVQGSTVAVWLALGASTVTSTIVVPQMYERDVAYWNHALDPATPAINLGEAREHFSSEGRARIEKILHDRPHTVQSDVLRSLAQLGVKEVLNAKQVSPDVVATATAKIPQKGPLSHYDYHTMMELAKNPALDDATFQLLCERGDDRVISVLTRNQGMTEARLQLLLREVQQRSAQAEKDPRTIEARRRGWRDLTRRIEARQTELKTPVPSPGNPP